MGVAASPLASARTDRTPGVTVRAVVVAGALLAVSGSAAMVAAGRGAGWLSSGAALLGAVALGWGAATLSAARHQPGNRVAWVLAPSALAGLAVACMAAESHLTGSVPVLAGGLGDVPAELAVPVAGLRALTLTASTLAVLLPLTFGFLLFPGGSLPSPRWRAVGLLAAIAVGGQCLAWLAAIQSGGDDAGLDSPVLRLALLTSGLAVLVGVAALIRRLRTGPGVLRQQARWVAWGAAVCAIALAAGIAVAVVAGEQLGMLLPASGVAILAGAYALAVREAWLHEIDRVISHSLVSAALAVFVVVVSIGSLVVASRVFGSAGDPNLVVAILATTGIAAGFRPLRGRLQAGIEGALLGRTATPHRVLSEFSRRVAANGEDPLTVVARSLVDGTGAVRAQVWLDAGGRRVMAAEWPAGMAVPLGESSRFVIAHGEVTLGALVLDVPAGGRLSLEDGDLVGQVAAGMGLALRNAMLAETLAQRVAQLRGSRRRLIALQDETRRRLERDLHDGAQQQLVALRVKLGLASVLAGRDGARQTGAAIDELAVLADTAIDALRELARGVYPPLLEAEGLAATITSEARRAPCPTILRVDGLGRYDRDLEGTVYMCVVEGLRQATGSGAGGEVAVTVAEMDGTLAFEVRHAGDLAGDTGPQPPREPPPRLGALADRVDTLSGRLSVGSPGDTSGVILAGEIPIGPGAAP